MIYKAKKIKGKGRGKLLGYPTINFEIPRGFNKEEGIYAGWVWIEKKKYKGAFHYGPVPTFGEDKKSFEVFLIDVDEDELHNPEQIFIEVELVRKIREVKKFSTPQKLSKQIARDIQEIRKNLQQAL